MSLLGKDLSIYVPAGLVQYVVTNEMGSAIKVCYKEQILFQKTATDMSRYVQVGSSVLCESIHFLMLHDVSDPLLPDGTIKQKLFKFDAELLAFVNTGLHFRGLMDVTKPRFGSDGRFLYAVSYEEFCLVKISPMSLEQAKIIELGPLLAVTSFSNRVFF